jgi:hypothetical protein
MYKTITSPAVLYGRETWPLTLREEHRSKRIFVSKREAETGCGVNFYNKELRISYSSSNTITVSKSRTVIWAGHVAYVCEL